MLRDGRHNHDPTAVPVASGVSGMNPAFESRTRKEDLKLHARLAQKLQDDMLRLMKEEVFSDLLFTNGKHSVPGHEIIVKSRLRGLLPENCLSPSSGSDKPSVHVQVDTMEELQQFVSTLYTSDNLDDAVILSKLKPANSSTMKDTHTLNQNVSNAHEEDTCEMDSLQEKSQLDDLQQNCTDIDPFVTISGDERMEMMENGLHYDALANTKVSSGKANSSAENLVSVLLQNTSPSLENDEFLENTIGSQENANISPGNTNVTNACAASESNETMSLCKFDTLESDQSQLPVCEADTQPVESFPNTTIGSAPGSGKSEDAGKDIAQGVTLVTSDRFSEFSETKLTVQETGSSSSCEGSLPTSDSSTLEDQTSKQKPSPLMSHKANSQVLVNFNSRVLGPMQETILSTSGKTTPQTSDNFEGQEVVQDIPVSTSLVEANLLTSGNSNGQERESLQKTFSTLGSNLLQFYMSGVDTDCCLVAEGQKFPAHRCILAVRCQYFDAMFTGSWCESSETEIQLHDVKARSLERILQFLYGAIIDVDTDISSTLQTADMFGMEELKQLVVFQITRDFCHFFHKPCQECLHSAQDVLLLASQYNLTELFDRTKQWVASHFRRIWEIQAFGSLSVSLLDLCTDFIIKGMSVSNITQVTLDAHDLLRVLQRFRRSEQIQAAAIKVMDAALEYAAEHFIQLVKSKHFLSWSKQGAWCCDVLSETYTMVISLLQPEMAVEVYNSLTQMYASMRLEEESFQRAIYSEEVMNMMTKLVERCEWYLKRYIHLVVQCPQWASLPKDKQQELLQKSSFVPVQTAGSGSAQSRVAPKSAAAMQQNIAHTVNMLCEMDATIFPYLSAIRASCQALPRPTAARQPEYRASAPRTTSTARTLKDKTKASPSHPSSRDAKGTGGMKGTRGAEHPPTLKKTVETSRISVSRQTAPHGSSAGPSKNEDCPNKVNSSRTLSLGSSKISGTPRTSSSASAAKVKDGSKASSVGSARDTAARKTKVDLNLVSVPSKVLPKSSGIKKVPSSQTSTSTSTDQYLESQNLLAQAATSTPNSTDGCEHNAVKTNDVSDAANTVTSNVAFIQPEVDSLNSEPPESYNAPKATSVMAGHGLTQPSRSANQAVVGSKSLKEVRQSPRNGSALKPRSATGSRSTGTKTDHKKKSSVLGPSSRPLFTRSGASAGPSSMPLSARSGTFVGQSSSSARSSARSSSCAVRPSAGPSSCAVRPSAGSSSCAVRPSAGSSSCAVRPSAGSSSCAVRPSAGSSSCAVRPSAGPSLRPNSAQSSASGQKLQGSQASAASKKGSGSSSKVSTMTSSLRHSSAQSNKPSHKPQDSQGAILGTDVKGFPRTNVSTARKASGSAGKSAAASSSVPTPRSRSTKSGAPGLQPDSCQVSASSTTEKRSKGVPSASTKKGSVLTAASLATPRSAQSDRPRPKPNGHQTTCTSSREKGAACSSHSVKVTMQKDEANSSKDLAQKDEMDFNEDLPQKDEVDSSEDLLQKDEVYSSKNLPQNDEVDSSKDLPQKDKVDSSKDLPQKEEVDSSKDLPQEDEADSSTGIPQNIEMDSSKDLTQKNEVDSKNDLLQKNETDSTADLLQKDAIDSRNDLPQKDEVDNSSKDLPQKAMVDSSKDLPQKDEVDAIKDLRQEAMVDSSTHLPQEAQVDSSRDFPQKDEMDSSRDFPQKDEVDSSKDFPPKDEVDYFPPKDEVDSSKDFPPKDEVDSSKDFPQKDEVGSSKNIPQEDEMADFYKDLLQKNEVDSSKNLPQQDEMDFCKDLPQKDEVDSRKDLSQKYEMDSTADVLQKDETGSCKYIPQKDEVDSCKDQVYSSKDVYEKDETDYITDLPQKDEADSSEVLGLH